MGYYWGENLYHYGVKRRSGRYPYGSGERPFQGDPKKLKKKNILKQFDDFLNKQIYKSISLKTLANPTSLLFKRKGFYFLDNNLVQNNNRIFMDNLNNFMNQNMINNIHNFM